MAFTFDQILAADPGTDGLVAKNASVLIFTPDDPDRMPLAIRRPDGTPMPNPVTTSDNGFGGVFVADIPRVAWAGGEFSGFFTSYDGMAAESAVNRAAAEAAAAAADASAAAAGNAQVAAEAAAAAAAESAVTEVDAYLAETVVEINEARAAAEQAALLVEAPADEVTAALVGNPESLTGGALSAAIEDLASVPNGVEKTLPLPVGAAGVFDYIFEAGRVGYGYHLRMGAGSVDGEYAVAVGTDLGLGGGFLFSHKNLGTAQTIIQQPGAGNGLRMEGFSPGGTLFAMESHVGTGGAVLRFMKGQGFADGQITSGSTTLTSATANFTAADVGKTITESTPTLGIIPAGTTIASVTNTTTVVLSKPATASVGSLALRFIVGDRLPSAAQNILRVWDEDNGVLLSFQREGMTVTNSGYFSNSRAQSKNVLTAANTNPAQYVAVLTGAAGQSVDFFRIRDSASAPIYRVGKDGHMISTAKVTPTDLVSGEFSLHFDTANSKLIVRAHNGTAVLKGELVLVP